jgi:membrane protein YdbS with pleckstrin-like domain
MNIKEILSLFILYCLIYGLSLMTYLFSPKEIYSESLRCIIALIIIINYKYIVPKFWRLHFKIFKGDKK